MNHHNSDYHAGEPACQGPAPKPATEGVIRVHRPVSSARSRLPRARHREAGSPPEDDPATRGGAGAHHACVARPKSGPPHAGGGDSSSKVAESPTREFRRCPRD